MTDKIEILSKTARDGGVAVQYKIGDEEIGIGLPEDATKDTPIMAAVREASKPLSLDKSFEQIQKEAADKEAAEKIINAENASEKASQEEAAAKDLRREQTAALISTGFTEDQTTTLFDIFG